MIKSVLIYEFVQKAVSAIAPNRCPFCRNVIPSGKYYCERCYEFLPFIKEELLPIENVSRRIACCFYRRRARKAVLWLKYGCMVYPVETFAFMISEKLSGIQADYIIPVPSSRKSIKSRGFAAGELIGKRVSMRTGIPMLKAVGAVNDKIDQKTLNSEERLLNAESSFFLKSGFDVRNKKIILIDDVSTTGATLSAIAGILIRAGADEVIAAFFAKTINYREMKLSGKKYRLRS